MRNALILILLVAVMGCTDPSTAPCNGFGGEPYINVQGDGRDTFGIYYLNDESFGDTLFTTSGNVQLPIDPSNGQMFYEIIADSSLGTFDINYNLRPTYCESADELMLLFEHFKFDTSTTYLRLSTFNGTTEQEIDTSFTYTGFFNRPKENHQLIIHF